MKKITMPEIWPPQYGQHPDICRWRHTSSRRGRAPPQTAWRNFKLQRTSKLVVGVFVCVRRVMCSRFLPPHSVPSLSPKQTSVSGSGAAQACLGPCFTRSGSPPLSVYAQRKAGCADRPSPNRSMSASYFWKPFACVRVWMYNFLCVFVATLLCHKEWVSII